MPEAGGQSGQGEGGRRGFVGKVAVDLVRGYSGKSRVDRTMCECCPFSRARIFATPGTVAHQAPPSMGFSRQEHWSGLPCHPPGDLPNPGSEPRSLMSSALAGGFFITSATWKAPWHSHLTLNLCFSRLPFCKFSWAYVYTYKQRCILVQNT